MASTIDMGVAAAALVAELGGFAKQTGRNPTPLQALSVFHADRPAARIPVLYEPCVCFVGAGRKRVFLDRTEYTYDPLNYLVVGVPLPVEAEITEATAQEPFLSLRLAIDLAMLAELVAELGETPGDTHLTPRGIYASPLTADISTGVLRLMRALRTPVDQRVLAPMAERELLYHLLQGEQGHALRAIAARDGRAHRIGATLRFMEQHYATPLAVDELAERAFMSASTYHHNFKALTGMSPLQYLKMIRLHRARLLLLHEGATAGGAAHAVGYNSQSQFTREFRRRFGNSPIGERKRLRGAYPTNATG
ncbi:MAG: AraC family transcriptional regulator [Pseudomonadota bacterium]